MSSTKVCEKCHLPNNRKNKSLVSHDLKNYRLKKKVFQQIHIFNTNQNLKHDDQFKKEYCSAHEKLFINQMKMMLTIMSFTAH